MNGLSSPSKQQPYIGRFAPSPTGELHLGSLIAAVASYLDAKHHHGQWLVRIEDLDPPREQEGASESIIHCLKAHGLHSDQAIIKQSNRLGIYQTITEQLLNNKQAFYCDCSRKQLAEYQGVYPGFCRQRQINNTEDLTGFAIRLKTNKQVIHFHDQIQGAIHDNIEESCGDFVIKRKDGLFAYQLAVVVDDYLQGITHIVRGSDLLDSTARQIYLQQQLDYPNLNYCHIPVLLNEQGQKFSKQNFAPAINPSEANNNLLTALQFLNQAPPPQNIQNNCEKILQWAIEHWTITNITATMGQNHHV